MRLLILVHRYLGIAIGWVLAMWCLSGFVMMYVGYPRLESTQRLEALQPIDWQRCCAYEKIGGALGVDVFENFNVEMVGDRLVLRVAQARGVRRTFDLASGELIESFDRDAALAVAKRYVPAPSYAEQLTRDQWTVSGEFNRDRPLHRIALNDEHGTELYVSSKTGAVVQLTTASERFWNWFGAVPHWLYPTVLRQHGKEWTQVVVYLSLAGVFLTAMGLYIGVSHWLAMRGSRLSPFRGAALWHHLSGLFFGVLALTWVGSGLASMSPWGLFAGGDFREERERFRDIWIDGTAVTAALKITAIQPAPIVATRIESAPFGGKHYVLSFSGAKVRRFSADTFAAAPIGMNDIVRVANGIANGGKFTVDLLDEGDTYYYSGHDPVELPVYRIMLDDADRTRYYLNYASGDIIAKVDPGQRQYRWLFEALHRFDFNAVLRSRPLWDIVVVSLLLGVTVICCTGVYMGYKRIAPKKAQR